MRNGKGNRIRFATIFLALSALGGLSGCHPCSFVQCGDWVKAEAFLDANGELYIDVPERKRFTHEELYNLSVSQFSDGMLSRSFWSIYRSAPHSVQYVPKTRGYADLPLRYGNNEPWMLVAVPPRKIENGVYVIHGNVLLVGDQEPRAPEIAGKFSYENGVVKNIK